MSIRQTVVAGLLGMSMLCTPFLAQAKETQAKEPTAQQKKETGEMCMMMSYVAHEALSERFANKSEKVAKQNLTKKFVDSKDKDVNKFFTGLVDLAVKDAYKLPVPKKANEKEQGLKEYAVGVFSGCVEEFGFKASDFSEADFE